MEEIISFVIRTKNEGRNIGKTLHSIKKQKLPLGWRCEIIIVDNESDDKTAEISAPYIDEFINISNKDFSWGRALNLGIGVAKGKYVALLSGHCILSENAIEQAINDLEHYDIAAVYAKQIGDTKKNKFEFIELNHFYPSIGYMEFQNSMSLKGISNAACFLRKAMWENEKFDEKLTSAEDAEWAKRVLLKGHILAYDAGIEIIHGHYLNYGYVYKKNYFRIYELDKNKNLLKIFLGSRYLFLFYRIVRQYIVYKHKGKEMSLDIQRMELLKYIWVEESGKIDARKKILQKVEINEKNWDIPKKIKMCQSKFM